MSYNDPGFLVNNRRTANEREADRLEWEYRREVARGHYRRATWLVVLAMIFIAVPTGLQQWNWHVVIGVGAIIAILAILMMIKGAVQNAFISLLFAGAILPIWVKAAPTVIKVVGDQASVIIKEWKRVW